MKHRGSLRLRVSMGIIGAVAMLVLSGCVAYIPGDSLTAADREGIARATRQALESIRTGESVNWANSATGHRGSVTPTRTFVAQSGAPCRDFRHTAVVGGQTYVAYDTACGGGDGIWRSINFGSLVASLDTLPDYGPPYPRYYYPYYYPYYVPYHGSFHFGYWKSHGHRRGYGRRHYRRGGSGYHFGYGLYF